MAARFYAAQPRVIVAVTGTNGKTSVAEFTRQIFATLGHTAASLGTIGLVKPDGSVYGSLTTPDPVSLHAALAGLASEGVTHLAFEASSHGLDQYRLDGVRLAAAAFTNLGRDHLDYHADENAYLAAKMRLFTELLRPGQPAVVNADGARAADVMAAARARGLGLFTTGKAGEHLRLVSLATDGFTQRIVVRHDGRDFPLRFPLPGSYQIENALLAVGLAIGAGAEPAAAINAMAALMGVKGRLEIVGRRAGGLAVVDYAHKPEALAAALDALRPFASGRLICVFGCGGDRDKGKRPIMGRIVVEKADVAIVTDDNPRSEKPEAIRAEILVAAPGAREIGDRAEAIGTGVRMLGAGDVLLVAGKGHETGQIVGNTVLPFFGSRGRPGRSRGRRCGWLMHKRSGAGRTWSWQRTAPLTERRPCLSPVFPLTPVRSPRAMFSWRLRWSVTAMPSCRQPLRAVLPQLWSAATTRAPPMMAH